MATPFQYGGLQRKQFAFIVNNHQVAGAAIHTVRFANWRRLCSRRWHRKKNVELSAVAGLAGDLDAATVVNDDSMDNGQTQTGPLAGRFGREEWIEDFVQVLRRDSVAGVANAQFVVQAGF